MRRGYVQGPTSLDTLILRQSFFAGTCVARALDVRTRDAEGMAQRMHDIVLGAAFLFAFPAAITLTAWAESEPVDADPPLVVAEGFARP